MAITHLEVRSGVSEGELIQLATSAGLEGKAIGEVIESYDAFQIWREEIEGRLGTLTGLRHHSNPHDPPDVELLFGDAVLPVEHTRLQPYPLGWARGVEKLIAPGQCTFVPSITSRPQNKLDLINSLLGIGHVPANLVQELAQGLNELIARVKSKIQKLPSGGIVCVIDRFTMLDRDTELICSALAQIFESEEFGEQPEHAVIVVNRWNLLEYASGLVRQQHPLKFKVQRVGQGGEKVRSED